MAKIGILGSRSANEVMGPNDIVDPKNAGLSYIFRLVYRVPANVKMAVVDLDGRLGKDVNNAWLAFDIKTDTSAMNAIILIDGPTINTDSTYMNTVYSRKCLVLGPGDCVYFRGTGDSSGVVTGIEHA